jgi:hypothetical protein
MIEFKGSHFERDVIFGDHKLFAYRRGVWAGLHGAERGGRRGTEET